MAIKRGTLAAIAPLAAASGVAAQCEGPVPQFTLNTTSLGSPVSTTVPIGSAFIQFRLQFPFGPQLILSGPPGYELISIASAVSAVPVSATLFPPNVPTTFLVQTANLCGHGAPSFDFCDTAMATAGLLIFDTASPKLGWMTMDVTYTPPFGPLVVNIQNRGMDGSPTNGVHVGVCSSLPVELVSFDAVVSEDGVGLVWETATELDNSGFEIQRESANGSWRRIGFVEGQGTTQRPSRYSFRDEAAVPNVHYRYRLKQIDFDGTSSFSKTVEVFTEDPNQVTLSEAHPNPVSSGRARFTIGVAAPEDASIEVFDIRGALVDSRIQQLHPGENRMDIDTGAMAAGPHFAKIVVGDRALYRQFVVVN